MRAFKNKKSRTPYVIARGDHRKTIKVIKLLRVKCESVTGIAMAHNIRCLLVRHRDQH